MERVENYVEMKIFVNKSAAASTQYDGLILALQLVC